MVDLIVDWLMTDSSNHMTSLDFLWSCLSTHVARTGEIGHASVTGIEKKGKINRRVRIALGSA